MELHAKVVPAVEVISVCMECTRPKGLAQFAGGTAPRLALFQAASSLPPGRPQANRKGGNRKGARAACRRDARYPVQGEPPEGSQYCRD